MLDLILPKIKCEVKTEKYGRFVIEPLERGYGITIGNTLRRVLLSSLPSAAVTSFRVRDIYHEFSPIPGVKEDMMDLTLNLKQLRLKLDTDSTEPVRLHLEVKGEGDVTAADLECPSGVELINPDLRLFTMDSPDAQVDMELTVERGRGYSPAEERGKLPIGEIAVDAVFSPIRKVNCDVERARVGQVANLDRLVMEIWTDGTIEADDALEEAARILNRHFSLISGAEEREEEIEEEAVPSPIYEMPIGELDLSTRVFNCLKRTGISQVGEVLERLEEGDEEMLQIRNFGVKSLAELKRKLRARGLLPRRFYKMSIEELGLSGRILGCLKRAEVSQVGEVLEMLRKGDEEMLKIRGFGEKSLAELKETLWIEGLLPEEGSE